MTESSDGWTAAKLGDRLDQADDLETSPSHWWVPWIDEDDVLRAMLLIKQHYDRGDLADHLDGDARIEDTPETAEETRLFRLLFRVGAGTSIHRAIRDTDIDRQSAMIGLDRDTSYYGIGSLVDLMGPGWIGYIFGQMGTGKTHFAARIAELLDIIGEGIEIGSNVHSLEDPRGETDIYHTKRREDLDDWIRGDGLKLFVYDEASSTGSGYSADAHEIMSNFRRLLQSFRKNECMMLIIGHTGKDVHPHILRQCDACLEKPDKQRARVFDEVDDQGEGVDLQFEIDGISGLERFEFDTSEMSDWYWSS